MPVTAPQRAKRPPPDANGKQRAAWLLDHHDTTNLYDTAIALGWQIWALGLQRSHQWITIDTDAHDIIATTSDPNHRIHLHALTGALAHAYSTDLPAREHHRFHRTLTTAISQPQAIPGTASNVRHIHALQHRPTQRHWQRPSRHLPPTTTLHARTGIPTDVIAYLTTGHHHALHTLTDTQIHQLKGFPVIHSKDRQ